MAGRQSSRVEVCFVVALSGGRDDSVGEVAKKEYRCGQSREKGIRRRTKAVKAMVFFLRQNERTIGRNVKDNHRKAGK